MRDWGEAIRGGSEKAAEQQGGGKAKREREREREREEDKMPFDPLSPSSASREYRSQHLD